ncbi:hypothetical protein F2P79_011473 [Pimephales promelas]|nr:hypothetical protein F2P79_011473 [Pimephales promelas]
MFEQVSYERKISMVELEEGALWSHKAERLWQCQGSADRLSGRGGAKESEGGDKAKLEDWLSSAVKEEIT